MSTTSTREASVLLGFFLHNFCRNGLFPHKLLKRFQKKSVQEQFGVHVWLYRSERTITLTTHFMSVVPFRNNKVLSELWSIVLMWSPSDSTPPWMALKWLLTSQNRTAKELWFTSQNKIMFLFFFTLAASFREDNSCVDSRAGGTLPTHLPFTPAPVPLALEQEKWQTTQIFLCFITLHPLSCSEIASPVGWLSSAWVSVWSGMEIDTVGIRSGDAAWPFEVLHAVEFLPDLTYRGKKKKRSRNQY